jgi:iron complex outermembrane receptor protein
MHTVLKRLTISALLVTFPTFAVASSKKDVFDMELEQLMNIRVETASRKSESLIKTAAAMHVITQDDIRRMGATSLPEVLRGVPGLHIAQIDSNNWAVSIRGLNDRFSNSLLVMIDGRSIYNPLFGGVYWNMHETLLEDIERIEVVRGPGGTVWGANAVNGVINIITKNARDTQGAQFTLLGGSQEGIFSARYGGMMNDQISYRLFTRGKRVQEFNDTPQHPANDQWRDLSSGFRVDGNMDATSKWTLQGGYNVGHAHSLTTTTSLMPPSVLPISDHVSYQSGNALFRWDKQFSDNNRWRVQSYYDFFGRHALNALNRIHTIDLEIQNQLRFAALQKHEFVWGVGYRAVIDDLDSSFIVSFNPHQRYTRTFNAFIQDDIQLTDKLKFTVGSKVEHNSYTGFEFQPNARMLFEINDRNSVWAAVSRAVRVPTRSENDFRINFLATPGRDQFSPPALFSLFGNRSLVTEKIYAAEVGYRTLLTNTLSFDTAGFFNYYDDLIGTRPNVGFETNPFPPHLLIGSLLSNNLTATAYGADMQAKWQPVDYWQLASSYTVFKYGCALSKWIYR